MLLKVYHNVILILKTKQIFVYKKKNKDKSWNTQAIASFLSSFLDK